MEKSMYDNIGKRELSDIFKKSKIFIQSSNSSAESDFIKACYNPSNALAGCTDYVDHRGDKLQDVKKMISEEIKTRLCQRGSYYNNASIPFDSVRVVLKYGGWSAYPHWSDGSMDFFSFKYKK
jgi:hypothetical protein